MEYYLGIKNEILISYVTCRSKDKMDTAFKTTI